MVTSDELFIVGLVSRHPALRPVLDEHLADNGEVLSYLLVADIERWAEQLVRDQPNGWAEAVTKVLDELEFGLSSGDGRVRNLILAGFVEQLPAPEETAGPLRELLPPALRHALGLFEGGA